MKNICDFNHESRYTTSILTTTSNKQCLADLNILKVYDQQRSEWNMQNFNWLVWFPLKYTFDGTLSFRYSCTQKGFFIIKCHCLAIRKMLAAPFCKVQHIKSGWWVLLLIRDQPFIFFSRYTVELYIPLYIIIFIYRKHDFVFW